MANEPAFSDILSSLMQNPQITDMISSLSGPQKADAEDDPPETKGKDGSTDGFTIPPELLSKLPEMMSYLSGTGMGSLPSLSSAKSKEDGEKKADNDQRKALLNALKPYLSQKRCAVIDGIIQLESIFKIMNVLNNTDKQE